jgi:methionyl-tRNA formyltransferase
MKIVLLGHDDVASAFALNKVIALCPQHEYAVFFSGALLQSTEMHPAMRQLADVDRVLFDRFMLRDDTATALKHAIELPAPNSSQGLQVLKQNQPDLIISIRYRRILRDAAIAIPTHGVLNLHSGILPDYKGVMATFWAMQNSETEIGSSLHFIVDAGIDTGPLLDISRISANYEESYLSNVLRLYDEGCRKIAQAVSRIDAGAKLNTSAQIAGSGRYFSSPSATEVTDFLGKGLYLVKDSDLSLVNLD